MADDELYWIVLQKLLTRLIDGGIAPDLACDIVTRLSIDVPANLNAAAIDDLVTIHTEHLLRMISRLYHMIYPLFNKPHSPSLSRVPAILTTMIGNLASQYRIGQTEPCPLCHGSGTTIAVDAMSIGPGYRHLVNPRPAVCMACDGVGTVLANVGDQDD